MVVAGRGRGGGVGEESYEKCILPFNFSTNEPIFTKFGLNFIPLEDTSTRIFFISAISNINIRTYVLMRWKRHYHH